MKDATASNNTNPIVADSKCTYLDYMSLASNPNPNTAAATATVANSKCTHVDYKQQALVLQQMVAACELEGDRLRAQKKMLEQLSSRIKSLTELKKAKELEGKCTKLFDEHINVIKKQHNEQISSLGAHRENIDVLKKLYNEKISSIGAHGESDGMPGLGFLMELKKAKELEGKCTKLLDEQIDLLKKQYKEQISLASIKLT